MYGKSTEYGSYLIRTLELIAKSEIHIIYYQHGFLSFPFTDVEKGNYDKYIKCRKEDILDKQITILHHFENEKLFKTTYNSKYNLDYKFIPIGYSENDPYLKPKKNPDYDLVFIGKTWDSRITNRSQHSSREPQIQEFFQSTPYKSAVIGKWPQDIIDKYKDVNFLGQIGKHGDAYNLFNNSQCNFVSGSKYARQLGFLPTRPIMVLRAGSIPLFYDSDEYLKKYLNPKFAVANKNEAVDIISEIKEWTIDEREKHCLNMLKNFPQWKNLDWGNIFGSIK